MTFQISALDPRRFDRFFAMSDAELADNLAARRVAMTKPGFPCRISLADAEIGEEVILVNHTHQDGASPFRAAHAIYVRKGAEQARPAIGETPEFFRSRMLSLRAFNDQAMIVAAELVEGAKLGPALESLLADPAVRDVHIHFAKYGCYAARAVRA